jgi:hypothetical protein
MQIKTNQEISQVCHALQSPPAHERFHADMVAAYLHLYSVIFYMRWWFGIEQYAEFFQATIERVDFS